ncbi:MAG: penicillin-binding protein 2 [Cyanobacteria bacterium SIG32]|nr:penicillin-binding protein 2 [Cyanobacteria bacterium SIG32]
MMILSSQGLNMKKKKISKKDWQKFLQGRYKGTVAFMKILFVCWSIGLVYSLFVTGVKDPKNYRVKARAQQVSKSVILRGDIYDRNGIKLATDEIYREVYAHKKRQEKQDPDYDPNILTVHSQSEVAEKLSPILDISEEELLNKLKVNDPIITLKRGIDKKTEQRVDAVGWIQDLSVGKKTKRTYPQGTLGAHVLGYYNFNADIASGVEQVAEKKLEYTQKFMPIYKTKDGNIIFDTDTDILATTTQPKGEDVTLTIDAAIQYIAEKELFKMAQERDVDNGFAIVMNPKNGEILAYAVYPNYDPNKYYKASEQDRNNWSLTGIYPPGSTFKIITIASAMDLGKIHENTQVYDTCKLKIAGTTIENSHCYPDGMISLVDLFERSSNVASFGIAKLMTDKEFYDKIRKFGFGQKTGIDLPGESPGILYSPKNWDGTTKLSLSYGYGTSVNAMQMVAAVGAVANNGVMVTPHVIKYSPEEAEKKVKYTQVISPNTAQTVTRLLAKSIEQGKSTLKMDKYQLAAKTGTSNKIVDGKYSSAQSYTSAIGYFPASNPQVLIYVGFDNPKGYGVWGNTVAGPVFHEIAEQTARILNLKQDK